MVLIGIDDDKSFPPFFPPLFLGWCVGGCWVGEVGWEHVVEFALK